MFNEKNKKAQVGETITWVVATLVIVVILTAGIFLASVAGIFKNSRQVEFYESSSRIPLKSFYNYLLTEKNGNVIFDGLKSEGDFNEVNGNFAKKIFEGIYGDYVDVWVGFNFEGFGIRKNDYFGGRPVNLRGGDINQRSVDYLSKEIYVDENKFFEFVLMDE